MGSADGRWYRGGGGGHSIVYRTVAHGNDHGVDVFRASEVHIHEDADRVLIHNLSLPNGKLVIFGLDHWRTGERRPCRLRAAMPGIELPFDQDSPDDAAFLARDDLERYELILTRGRTEREGVVFGPPTLDLFYARRSI